MKQIDENTYQLNDNQVLKKTKKGDYRLIYPIKIDNKINWKNMFKVDFTILILMIAIALILYNQHINLEECKEVINNPCEYCKSTQNINIPFSMEVNNVIGKEYPRDSIGDNKRELQG